MVKLKYQFSRLITSLLSLTLVSAVLMPAPAAFADDESVTTCGVDVVFLMDTGHSAAGGFGRIEEHLRLRKLTGKTLTMNGAPGYS